MTDITEVSDDTVTSEELRILCDATVRLVEIRQRGCSHVCVENVAPEILHKLLTRLKMSKRGEGCLHRWDAFLPKPSADKRKDVM